MAARQQNDPNVQYLIEVSVPLTGYVVDRYTIEQCETGHRAGTGDHPNYNTVQRHLNELSVSTGLDYKIVRWGDVMDRRAWVAGGPLND